MNSSEKKVKMILEGRGYNVLHTGAPDFLCYKNHLLGLEKDKILFVEVKSGNSRILNEQLAWAMVLEKLGAKVAIVHSDDPDDIARMLKKAKV